MGSSAKYHKDTSEIRTGKDFGFGSYKFWKVHFPKEESQKHTRLLVMRQGLGAKNLEVIGHVAFI